MRSLLTLLVPAIALSLGAFACSGSDSSDVEEAGDTTSQQVQLVDEGRECSVQKKCKPGLVCVARVKGGDVGVKGVPAPPCDPDKEKDCGWSSSSSSTGGSTTSSTGGTSGWSSSTSSTGGTSGWSSSTSSTGGTSGSTSSSSGSTPEVGICMTVR